MHVMRVSRDFRMMAAIMFFFYTPQSVSHCPPTIKGSPVITVFINHTRFEAPQELVGYLSSKATTPTSVLS